MELFSFPQIMLLIAIGLIVYAVRSSKKSKTSKAISVKKSARYYLARKPAVRTTEDLIDGKVIVIVAFNRQGDAIAQYHDDFQKEAAGAKRPCFVLWDSERLSLFKEKSYEVDKQRNGEVALKNLDLKLTSDDVAK